MARLQYMSANRTATFDSLSASDQLALTQVLQVYDLALSSLWTLICAYLVFFMQCGFALLEAGSVRAKNTRNILLKNVIDACVSAIMWWSLGVAFAGIDLCDGNPFLGSKYFFTIGSPQNDPSYFINWMFGWAFSATAATVVSGAMAERTQFGAYVSYTIFMSGWVYPVVAHWMWSVSGWLSPYRLNCATRVFAPLFASTVGFIDFAGSGVVHVTGGIACLVGAAILGPRLGRFTADGHVCLMPASSPAYQALGTLILWLSWYGFNSGSTNCFSTSECVSVAATVSVNTTLAAGTAGATALLLSVLRGSPGDVTPLLNGIITGLVSVTAGCATVENYGAVVIGAVAALVYLGGIAFLRKVRVDDPVEATAVHFFGGAWGVIAAGLLSTEKGTLAAYGHNEGWGLLYGGGGAQFGVQILGLLVITVWSGALMGILFYIMRVCGWLRVPREEEYAGLDLAHGLGKGFAWDPRWLLKKLGFGKPRKDDGTTTESNPSWSAGMRRVSMDQSRSSRAGTSQLDEGSDKNGIKRLSGAVRAGSHQI